MDAPHRGEAPRPASSYVAHTVLVKLPHWAWCNCEQGRQLCTSAGQTVAITATHTQREREREG
jgi:hypothetical protein